MADNATCGEKCPGEGFDTCLRPTGHDGLHDNPLARWCREHGVDPSRTPARGGARIYGPVVVFEQYAAGPRRLNRRGTRCKRSLPKVRRLRRPKPADPVA